MRDLDLLMKSIAYDGLILMFDAYLDDDVCPKDLDAYDLVD